MRARAGSGAALESAPPERNIPAGTHPLIDNARRDHDPVPAAGINIL